MFSACQDDLSKTYFDLKRSRSLKRLEEEIALEDAKRENNTSIGILLFF